MTANWLENDLKRRSACLAIRRVIGSHTYDVIAKEIHSIHKEFGIVNKVNCTITDSGSHFLKAFRIFGDVHGGEDSLEEEIPENFDDYEAETEDKFVYVDIGDLIENFEKETADKQLSSEDSEEEI